jgi:hypothetical protein
MGTRIEKLIEEVRSECGQYYKPEARLLRAIEDIDMVFRAGAQLATEVRLHLAGAEYGSRLPEALERWEALAGGKGEEYRIPPSVAREL